MSDIEDYGDGEDNIDYDPNEGMMDDMPEEGGLNFEDMFIEAERSADPIKAYKDLIELETSSSEEHKWTYKSYEKLAALYLKSLDLSGFEESVKKIAFWYPKIGDYDKQDTFREISLNIKNIPDFEKKKNFFLAALKILKEEDISKEYLYIGVELCKLLSVSKKFSELEKIVSELMERVQKMDEDETLKNVKLQLIIMEIQICKSQGNSIDIKSLYLEANKLMKDQVFEDKYLTAIINEEGGKICMRQKDFKQALGKFKFSFHSYRDMGSEEAVIVLKYAFIVSLLVLDSSIIVTKDEANPYKDNQSLMNIVNLFDAFVNLDINKLNNIWNKEIVPKEKDPFIKENMEDIIYNIRLNYIAQKLKSYKSCKFEVLEKEMGIHNKELIGMLMNIAKNEYADLKINFVKQQIEMNDKDEKNNNTTKLLKNYAKWFNSFN